MNKTFYSYSFGCRVNQAEKEEFDRQLLQLGYRYDENRPDIYIINSCSVTHKAEREAKQLVYQIKRKNPDTKVVVTGCAATNWIKVKAIIPEIDLLIDNQNKEYLASLVQKRFAANTQPTISSTLSPKVNDKYLNSGRIIIKIQEGCHRFCSFCIVPYLRGLPQSYPIQSIIDKIKDYEKQVKEVILVAINTEAYGYDTKIPFIELLDKIVVSTSVPRLSFGSIHPWTVNDRFFEFYKRVLPQKRIVDFFHIPLQSGSNKILTLMKRGYTREEFIEKLHMLKTINPYAFIGTDVIVGYLEETDRDFEDTYEFLEKTPISKFHIFRYSKRQHTAAFYLAKRLKEPDAQTKQKRAKALEELNKKKYEMFLQKHVGKTFPALFLEQRDSGVQSAVLSNQVPIKVITNADHTAHIRQVKITEYKRGELLGRNVQ